MLLYDLLLPCIFDLFDVVCYLMHAFAHLVAVGVNEIRNSVQASDIPAVFVNKRGKLTLKFSEIVFVLPLCFWSGFLLVGNTAAMQTMIRCERYLRRILSMCFGM